MARVRWCNRGGDHDQPDAMRPVEVKSYVVFEAKAAQGQGNFAP